MEKENFRRVPLYSFRWPPRGTQDIPKDQARVLLARHEERYQALCGRMPSVPTEQGGNRYTTRVAATVANSSESLDGYQHGFRYGAASMQREVCDTGGS